MFILAQFIGALGIFVNILVYQKNEGNKLLKFKLISDLLWSAHYFLLGAYTGTAVAIIAILRETVFINNKKPKKGWLAFFIMCSIVSAFFTWKSAYSILPTIGSIVAVISFWRKTPELTRVLAIVISVCMIVYDIVYSSYTGIINEVMTLISVLFALYRYKN